MLIVDDLEHYVVPHRLKRLALNVGEEDLAIFIRAMALQELPRFVFGTHHN